MSSIVFVGDIAIHPSIEFQVPQFPWAESTPVVANLEGPLVADDYSGSRGAVYTSSATASGIAQMGVRAVTLANNHALDLPANLLPTLTILRAIGIRPFGAGRDLCAAQEPVRLRLNDAEIALLGFGWGPIGCKGATKRRHGVSPLSQQSVLRGIEKARHRFPGIPVTLFMHWGYELEWAPLPMDRKLAHDAIEAGADAVIGCHSHTVQGYETHGGRPILYGLGNWMFSQGAFWGGQLVFPERAALQLAFEYRGSEHLLHWFRYHRQPHRLEYLETDDAHSSSRMDDLTPYRGMPHGDYIAWFKANRIKKRLLPVYRSREEAVRNALYDYWLRARSAAVRRVRKAPTAAVKGRRT